MQSIKEFGFVNPVLVHGEKHKLVCGHGRVEAAKKLGLTEVPCIDVSHLDDAGRRAFALAENNITLMTGFSMEKLEKELDKLSKAFDFGSFGFDMKEELPVSNLKLDAPKIECPQCKFKFTEAESNAN